jgi:hypothetical protein
MSKLADIFMDYIMENVYNQINVDGFIGYGGGGIGIVTRLKDRYNKYITKQKMSKDYFFGYIEKDGKLKEAAITAGNKIAIVDEVLITGNGCLETAARMHALEDLLKTQEVLGKEDFKKKMIFPLALFGFNAMAYDVNSNKQRSDFIGEQIDKVYHETNGKIQILSIANVKDVLKFNINKIADQPYKAMKEYLLSQKIDLEDIDANST